MASITFLPLKADASYIFADPSGFSSQTSALSLYNFLGTGDLGITAPFQGENISFTTSTVNFGAAGLNNPAWMGGSRTLFGLAYSGSQSGGPKELAQLEFTFANPLTSQSYILFADFDSYEGVAIAAFDQSNNLIPFADFALTRLDGEDPGGASSTTPDWTNTNPKQTWATADNTGWTGTSEVSGYLNDTTNFSTNDRAVALQANADIGRIVFYYNAEATSGTGSNTLKFNFASPGSVDAVPGPMPVLGVFAAFGFSRKLRQRLKG